MDDGTSAIWAELRQQRDLLIELRTLMQGTAEFKTDAIKRFDGLDERVTELEARRWPLGVLTGLAMLVSAAVAVFAALGR